jgi:hypothetical protein
MDVFITPEARHEIDALRAFRPKLGAWGVIIGHKRGPRFIVEKVLTAGSSGTVPDERSLAEFEGIWPGRVIGIMIARPAAALKKALLGPAWFGRLVLQSTGPARTPVLSSSVVGFGRRFRFEPVPFAPPVEGEGP